jgi:hypothetical protein
MSSTPASGFTISFLSGGRSDADHGIRVMFHPKRRSGRALPKDDAIQMPTIGDPLELVLAGILEVESGSGPDVPDGPRNEHVACVCLARNA